MSTTTEVFSTRVLPLNDASIENLLVQHFARVDGMVSVQVHDGVVFLHGILRSYYLKQLAQEVAMGADGVHQVVNGIEVGSPARLKSGRQML